MDRQHQANRTKVLLSFSPHSHSYHRNCRVLPQRIFVGGKNRSRVASILKYRTGQERAETLLGGGEGEREGERMGNEDGNGSLDEDVEEEKRGAEEEEVDSGGTDWKGGQKQETEDRE